MEQLLYGGATVVEVHVLLQFGVVLFSHTGYFFVKVTLFFLIPPATK